jgi:cyanate lyase
MNKQEMTELILHAKAEKRLSWAQIAQAAGLSEVFTTSACLGENTLAREEALKVTSLLDIGPIVADALARPATKGEQAATVSKEPLQYRLHEIVYVYGRTIKELIEEKFGLGIMSAIDFTMDIEKQADPKGDRVVITMNGKFLPYKKW